MHEQPDIHARLMSVYPQVPEWWYAGIFRTLFFINCAESDIKAATFFSVDVRYWYHIYRNMAD